MVKQIKKIVKKSLKTITVKNAYGEPDTTAKVLVQSKIKWTPKVSVIIPVYNVEKYLRQCLDSVVYQTLQEIEIICVDDGSTDSSLDILKEYAEKDPRITVMTQENLHAGVARNAGLAVACGEYLSFLDSDDFFEPNMLAETYKNAVLNNSDIVMFNAYLYDDTTKENKEVDWTLNTTGVPAVFNYKNIPDRIFKLSNCWVWNRLYSYDFVKKHGLHFQNLGCANDTYFSCIASVLAQKITYINTRFVHYRTNRQQFENTTSVSFRHKHPTDLLKCFYDIYNELKKLKLYDIVRESYLVVATEHISWSEQAFVNDKDLHKQFVDFLANNYGEIFKEARPFTNNTLNKKYVKLRNALVDAGVFKEIPKRIFYVWGANETIRPEVKKCIDTWKKFLPDYDIVQIDEESKEYFDFQQELEQNKWFRTVYERKMWAYVADYIRVKTLFDNGGIYFDTDVSVVQNMDRFLQDSAFVGMQRSSLDGNGDWVEPAICGAQKQNNFFKKIVSFYDELIWKEPIYTMPHLFNYYLRKYDIFPFPKKSEQKIIKLPDITIYPERYFIPYRWNTEFKPECIEPDTYTIHHWGGSWTKPEIQWFLKNKHLPHVKVSVIVCVYNDAKYVSECLNSLIKQTLKDIEIICVNDGSVDNSLEILEKFTKQDPRITVINQKNSGLATSRNNALKVARGEYCDFVDSDDYLTSDALEKLYNHAKTHNLDMLAFSGYNFDADSNELYNPYWDFSYLPTDWNKTVFTYKDCLDFMHRMAVSSCLTMYKTEFIIKNGLKFPDGLVYEDNIFWTTAFTKDAKFGILNEKLYRRRLHDASITHNWQKNFSDWLKINDMLFEYLKSINIDKNTLKNYMDLRLVDVRARFNKLNSNDRKKIQSEYYAFLYKYIFKKNLKPYLFFPYYGVANMWMKNITIPLVKFKKHMKQVMYSHSTRCRMDKINEKLNKVSQSIQSIDKQVNSLQTGMQNNFDRLNKSVEHDQVFYYNPFETVTRFERGLCDMAHAPDFENRFKKLISGLSAEDASTIVKIIRRLQLIKGTNSKLDLFTTNEKESLRRVREMNREILKVSDNLYAYKNYLLPINHFEASVFFYNHGIKRLDSLDVFKNKDILDVGGFIGDSILMLAPLTNKKIYSFEATKANYELMKKTIELNGIKNAVPVNVAVGDKPGEIELLFNGASSSSDSIMVKNPEYIERCPVITIDDYVREHNIDVGLIKVDIEGAEQSFLRGARKTIEKYKPTLLISIYHNVGDFLDIKPMIESWNLGYKFKVFKPTIESVSGETLLICEQ